MADERDYDAIICGAGVGGLTVALLLGRAGYSVLLLEKQAMMAPTFKGELLQPGSLRILDDLGLLPALHARGAARIDRLISTDDNNNELCAMDYRWLGGSYDHCLTATYQEICSVLENALPPNVEFVRRVVVDSVTRGAGTRVTGVRLRGDYPHETAHAALVVAADGYSSKLRNDVGIEVNSNIYNHQVVAVDLTHEPHLTSTANTVVTPSGMRVMYPMSAGGGRLYIQIPKGFANSLGKAGLREWVIRSVDDSPALRPLSESVKLGLNGSRTLSARRFVVDRFHHPGLALIGDAAHSVHPMAGQGMNAAIGDAVALSRLITPAAFANPHIIDNTLVRYTATRHPEVVTLSEFSHRFAELLTTTTTPIGHATSRYVLLKHGDNQRLCFKIMHNISGLGYQKFSPLDRLQQLGFPDPSRHNLPTPSQRAPTH